MGQKDTFDMSHVCTEANAGGALAGKVPVIVAYVAAFYAKRHNGRCDCNVSTCGANNDLCHYGAADINNNLTSIVNVYKSYAQGFASCYGTTKPIVFEMEPDFYQYTAAASRARPGPSQQAGQIMSQFVNAMKTYLPNAAFSMDISPWVGTNNNTGGDGSDNGKNWYSYFDMSLFTFINTSGGGTRRGDGQDPRRQDDLGGREPGDRQADPGGHRLRRERLVQRARRGVGQRHATSTPAWTTASISISQYNPASNWGSTISSVRSQLNTPGACP